MIKKITAMLTLLAFLVFSYSCTMTTFERRRENISVDELTKTENYITGVQTRSGEYIEFWDEYPAKVDQGQIKGHLSEIEEIDMDQIESSSPYGQTRYYTINTYRGKEYRGILTKDDKYLGRELFSIPLTDVDLVWVNRVTEIKKSDPEATGLLITSIILITATAIILIATSGGESYTPPTSYPSDGSCPFIYSYDGEKYILDAEPYGGAYAQGLQRTDWCALENLKEVETER